MTFCAGLERALGPARPARVFNASVPSTGTTDQLQRLERLLGEFEPAVVLVASYDNHLSAEGHAVAARELARHFEANPITGPSPHCARSAR